MLATQAAVPAPPTVAPVVPPSPQLQMPAPAGQTAAGLVGSLFGRTTPQGPAAHQHTLAWSLNQVPDRQRAGSRPAETDAGASYLQWIFWGITLTAYLALAIAALAVVRTGGGGLQHTDGSLGYGGWALAVACVTGVASWFCSRRLQAIQAGIGRTRLGESSTQSKGSTP